jgi:hypothetical protein
MTDTLTHFIGGEAVGGDPRGEASTRPTLDDVVARYPKAARPKSTPRCRRAGRISRPGRRPRRRCAPTCSTRRARSSCAREGELGELLSREEGKTLPKASARRVRAARIFKYFAGEALRRTAQNLDSTARRRRRDPSRGGRRRRPDHAVEFPDRHPGLEDRAGARLRQHRGAQAGRPVPAIAHALARSSSKPGARPGVFNLVIGEARSRRTPSSTIPTSTASPSPARSRVGAQGRRRRRVARRRACSWRWAARTRWSCSTTPISTAR